MHTVHSFRYTECKSGLIARRLLWNATIISIKTPMSEGINYPEFWSMTNIEDEQWRGWETGAARWSVALHTPLRHRTSFCWTRFTLPRSIFVLFLKISQPQLVWAQLSKLSGAKRPINFWLHVHASLRTETATQPAQKGFGLSPVQWVAGPKKYIY